eukprot:scaffold900_cov399-Pavlova_lutheri.AAC.10
MKWQDNHLRARRTNGDNDFGRAFATITMQDSLRLVGRVVKSLKVFHPSACAERRPVLSSSA